jgi:hypothetical protein
MITVARITADQKQEAEWTVIYREAEEDGNWEWREKHFKNKCDAAEFLDWLENQQPKKGRRYQVGIE